MDSSKNSLKDTFLHLWLFHPTRSVESTQFFIMLNNCFKILLMMTFSRKNLCWD